METFMLVSKKLMVNLSTFKLVPLNDETVPERLIVPCYLWGIEARTSFAMLKDIWKGAPPYECIVRYTECLDLLGMQIQFIGHKGNGGLGSSIIFKFQDKLSGKISEMVIGIHQLQIPVMTSDHVVYLQEGVVYEIFFNGKELRYQTMYSETRDSVPRFRTVKNLGKCLFRGHDNDFYFGIPARKMKLLCRGHDLGQSKHIMLMGTWAVILTDELSVDSVVLLDGVGNSYISIDRFLYTQNGAYAKYLMLTR